MTKNKGQRPVISARVDQEVFDAITAEAKAEFETVSEIAGRRLAAAYAGGMPEPLEKSAATLQRERKTEIENELLDLRLKKERRETLTVDQVLTFVEREYGIIRSRLLNIPQSVVGLNAEQVADLKKTVQDVMTDLSGEQREAWDDIADQ